MSLAVWTVYKSLARQVENDHEDVTISAAQDSVMVDSGNGEWYSRQE